MDLRMFLCINAVLSVRCMCVFINTVFSVCCVCWCVRVCVCVILCRECCRFFGDDGLTAKVFFTKVAPFGLLWTLTNYLYFQALRKINTTDVSTLFCCNKAFVFLLSWIVLRDRFMGVRVSLPFTTSRVNVCWLLYDACLSKSTGVTAHSLEGLLQRIM